MRSASTKTLLCALCLSLAPAACTLIAEVDRAKIDDGGGTGGEGLGGEPATGGQGGDSGADGGNNGEGGIGGEGGMGGAD